MPRCILTLTYLNIRRLTSTYPRLYLCRYVAQVQFLQASSTNIQMLDDDDDDDDTSTMAHSTPLPSPAAAAAAARGGIEALTIAKMRAELASGPVAALGLGGAGDAILGIYTCIINHHAALIADDRLMTTW